MVKKCTFLVLMIVFLAIISGQTGNAESSFAKLGMTSSPEHPTSKSLDTFRKEVKRILDDQLTIQIFFESQLGSAQQILEGLQFGNIEMGILSIQLLTARLPLLSAISMPYIFRDDGHRVRVLDGPVGKQLLHKLEAVNLVGLGFLDTGMKNFITKASPLQTPGDFKGQTIGLSHHCVELDCQDITLQLSLQSLEIMGAIGKRFTTETSEDVLQQEEMTGIEYTPLAGIETTLNTSELKYFSLHAYSTIPDVLVASKRWFDSLSPQMQQALRKASSAMVRQQRQLWTDAVQQAYAGLQEQGIIFETVERESFREANEAIYRHMFKQAGPDFENIIQAIMNVR